jgi:hypothetical protein
MTTTVFLTLSALAIVTGGLLSAFSARRPTRQTSWASAYLVLVVGVIQFGIVVAWQHLGHPDAALAAVALTMYNLGNMLVIVGTILKARLPLYRMLVNGVGTVIGVAMALLLITVRNVAASWTLAGFIILTSVILVSMPVGLTLSAKRRN